MDQTTDAFRQELRQELADQINERIDRRHSENNARFEHLERLAEENRLAHLANALSHDTNAAALRANTLVTNDIYEIVTMGRGFFKVLGVIGTSIKWAAGIATAILAAWAAFHHKG